MNMVYNQMGQQDRVEQSASKGGKSKTGGYFGLSAGLNKSKAPAMPQKSSQMNDELSSNLFNA